jgi:hypothetical protein|tara:strand:- start:85 stop:1251 length:1167 start_codon:yes stop_codon:yes gene_type:complete
MKNIFLIVLIIASAFAYAEDYETAQRFEEGDTISADVLNDILDRIELSLKSSTTSDLLGSWDVAWKTCINGGPGNCSSLNAGSGWSSSIDNLYRTRSDVWTISDDGDGTYSLSITNYCISGASSGAYYNDSCTGRVNVEGGIFLFGTETGVGVSQDSDHTETYNIKKVSQNRFQLWQLKSGSNSFVGFTLDKQSQPPKAPKELAITLASGKAALSWSAGDNTETGYDVRRRASVDEDYASLATPTAETYEDSSIVKGNSYWYRVFATNANGTSIGSNVIQIAYLNTPPSMNLSSTISLNEGITEVVNVGATDADGDSLTYSIGSQDPSNDATNFSISSTGVISFNSAPDYENPSDYGTNNIYDITVTVSDGIDSVSQDVGVVVLDVSE